MIAPRERERQDALRQLLARADPPDLPHRGRRYTYAGNPVLQDALKQELERAYIRHRLQAAGVIEESIGAVRRYALRLVQRA